MTTQTDPRPIAERRRLSPADQDHNNLYICCILLRYPDQFLVNGAVRLNHMLQERGKIDRETAFGIVSDALQSGLVRLDKYNGKKLTLVQETFRPFRDRMIGEIGRVQAEVVTFQWNLKTANKVLSEVERQQLAEHVGKGLLSDIQKDTRDLFASFEQMVEKAYHEMVRPPSERERTIFMDSLQDSFRRFADSLGPNDFVLLVSKNGNTVKTKLKILQKSVAISLPD